MVRFLRRCAAFVVVIVVAIAVVVWLDVAVALGYADWSPASSAPPVSGSAQPRLVILGDSLPYGKAAAPGQDWIDDLRRRLAARAPASVVVDLAVPGARIGQVGEQIPRAGDAGVGAAFVVAGTNDVLSLADPFAIAIDEHGVLARIRRLYPRAAIVVATVPDFSRTAFRLHVRGAPRPSGFALQALVWLTEIDNTVIRQMTHRFGGHVVDLQPAMPHAAGNLVVLGNLAWPAVARALRVDPK